MNSVLQTAKVCFGNVDIFPLLWTKIQIVRDILQLQIAGFGNPRDLVNF